MLNFICALKHEARPIIDHFQLVHEGPGRPYITYRNKNGTISLTITGVGKDAAAAGTSHAFENFQSDRTDTWLNIGIAGHKDLAVGTPVLAGTITDSASGRVWQPGVIFDAGLVTLPLVTVDQPLDDYPDNAMIDMEAAGFFSSVCRAAPMDGIHCLKIISDNMRYPSHNISKQSVIDLIAGNINLIDAFVTRLHAHGDYQATAI